MRRLASIIRIAFGKHDVNVLEQHALRSDHGHGPHLGLYEAKAFNHGLFRIGYRDGVRPAMHVRPALVP
jgi:hypothetical protein